MIEVAALLHVRDGRLLMTRRKGKNGFYLPGGKIDPGESAVDALHREIGEELAVRIVAGTIRPFNHYVEQAFGEPPGVKVSVRAYTALLGGEPAASSEIAEIRYFTSQEYFRQAFRAPASEAAIGELLDRGLMQ